MGQIPRERRITTRRDVLRLLKGRRARSDALELFWSAAAGPRSRATCITPKYGHTSVARNRLRRRLKELLRSRLLARDEPLDYLVRARPPAYDLAFGELATLLDGLAARIESTTTPRTDPDP